MVLGALVGTVLAFVGIYLTDHHTGPGGGAHRDGVASIAIGPVLGVVAFVLARFSRGLLPGEAANPDARERIRKAMPKRPNVVEVIELLTTHFAPGQILINAHVNFRDDRATERAVAGEPMPRHVG